MSRPHYPPLWRQSGFPIPMRGNEQSIPIASDHPAFEFPIPMRGNELRYDGGDTARLSWFPIPMRGNEMRLAPVVWQPCIVPDPHEG